MTIEQRLAKLEQRTRGMGDPDRVPGVSDGAMQQIRQVAAIVATPAELEAYLGSLHDVSAENVVALADHRRADAVRGAFARAIFDEARA